MIFAAVVVAWFIFDRLTKGYFEEHGAVAGEAPSFLGIVKFELVHNRGAAWGSFAGMVDVLIIVTSLLLLAIAIYALVMAKSAPVLEVIGFGLIFAGGIGNLVDRIVNGYVVDFIAPQFIDFPTFNIADVGITCGIVIVLIAFAHKQLKER